MKIKNIKTNEILEFQSTLQNYLVKCDGPEYATHTDEEGNYYCMYGTYIAFDGEKNIYYNFRITD